MAETKTIPRDAKPDRVVESAAQWEEKAVDTSPVWKETSETIAEEMWSEAPPPPLSEQEGHPDHPLRTWLVEMGKRVLGKMPHARGDPHARVGRTTDYTWFCGYLLGFVVDTLCQNITAVVWGSGNIKQYKLFEPAMDAHIERVGDPQAAAADSAFDDPHVQTVGAFDTGDLTDGATHPGGAPTGAGTTDIAFSWICCGIS